MTVRFYTRRDAGYAVGFRHTFERSAAIRIANLFMGCYGDLQTLDFALIFNLEEPPADLLILTNNGIGVVDLKAYDGVIRGTTDTIWTTSDITGGSVRSVNPDSKYVNPFQQVKDYRMRAFESLRLFAMGPHGRNLPDWMRYGSYHLQAAVAFAEDSTDIALNLNPDETRPWFHAIHESELCTWAYSLAFTGDAERLDKKALDYLATLHYGAMEWEEIKPLVAGSNIYGYLHLYDGNNSLITTYPLSQPEVTIGRERDNDIRLSSNSISRRHARVIRENANVYIEDLGSTYGTWHTGNKLKRNKRTRLKDGCELAFGPFDTGDAQRAVFRTTHTPEDNLGATRLE